MDLTPTDALRPLAEWFALGALGPSDRTRFVAHLESGCRECAEAVRTATCVLWMLCGSSEPDERVRAQVMDLADAPRLPIDTGAFAWEDIAPGIRLHMAKEDASRGMKACVVWAEAGAKNAIHRHEGEELILVLKGALRDGRGEYGPGEICHSRAGSVHFEEVMGQDDCFSYVVYYGGLSYLP